VGPHLVDGDVVQRTLGRQGRRFRRRLEILEQLVWAAWSPKSISRLRAQLGHSAARVPCGGELDLDFIGQVLTGELWSADVRGDRSADAALVQQQTEV
jgi:hypothetical protein